MRACLPAYSTACLPAPLLSVRSALLCNHSCCRVWPACLARELDLWAWPAADIDERAAQALDFIVAEAGRLGIRLTPVLLNTWKAPNGIPSFEKWWAGPLGLHGSVERAALHAQPVVRHERLWVLHSVRPVGKATESYLASPKHFSHPFSKLQVRHRRVFGSPPPRQGPPRQRPAEPAGAPADALRLAHVPKMPPAGLAVHEVAAQPARCCAWGPARCISGMDCLLVGL